MVGVRSRSLVRKCQQVAVAWGLAGAALLVPGVASAAPVDYTTNGIRFVGSYTGSPATTLNISGVATGSGLGNGYNLTTTVTRVSSTEIDISGSFGLVGSSSQSPFSCRYNTATGAKSSSACYFYEIFSGVTLGAASEVAKAEGEKQAVTTSQTARIGAQNSVALAERRISSALANVFGGRTRTADSGLQQFQENGVVGIASGDGAMTRSLWSSYSHNWVSNDWAAAKSRGDIDTGMVGGDLRVTENFLLGFAMNYQNTSLTTNFNDGWSDSNMFSLMPYAAVSFLDGAVVWDIMGGYGFGGYDVRRNRSTLETSGNFDADRVLFSTNINGFHRLDQLNLSAKLGFLWTNEGTSAYTDSLGVRFDGQASKVGEVSLGGRAGYALGDFEPYVGLTYHYDVDIKPLKAGVDTLSRNDIETAVGLNWNYSERLIAGLEVTKIFLRTKEDNIGVAASLRFLF